MNNPQNRSKKIFDQNIEVPNDFTGISILPSIHELTSRKNVFVRPNIIDGAYKNVEHYLDVHFRLMREDLISTIRESLISYIKNPKRKTFEGGR